MQVSLSIMTIMPNNNTCSGGGMRRDFVPRGGYGGGGGGFGGGDRWGNRGGGRGGPR